MNGLHGLQRNAGFTLVEIAIVLVIIGLLLGGVLKGQEMIDNARIKNLISSMDGIGAAFHAYQDRYKALPGDDSLASPAGRGWTDALPGNGLGSLANNNAFNAGGSENQYLWQHLRYAGFITGNPAGAVNNVGSRANPTHAYNGKLGVTATTAAWGLGLRGNILCASAVPAKAAQAIDSQFDDGIANAGTVRSILAVSNAPQDEEPAGVVPAAAYIDNGANVYTICRKM